MNKIIQNGFTLVELLITIIIISIILTIALPALQNLIINDRIRTTTNDIYFSIAIARSEAMKRNGLVDIFPVGTTWNSGWQVRTNGGTNYIIQERETINSAIVINGPTESGTPIQITYNSSGRLTTNSTGITFVIFPISQEKINARCVTINLSGMPEIKVDSDGDVTNGC
jgi:type IV fimbrial biogenesis protein FimT